LADERGFRARFVEILRTKPNRTMFITDLIVECSLDADFYLTRQTANFHLSKMCDAGIVEITDIPTQKKSEEGRLKIQAVVTLKKDVQVFVKDL